MAVLIVGLIIFTNSVCFAQQAEEVVSFNFGKIRSDEIVTHRFIFKDRIESAVSLCECLVLNVYKENGKYIVEVRFDSGNYRGKVEEEAILLIQGNRKVRIKIYAEVE